MCIRDRFWVHDTAAEAGLDMNTSFLGIGGTFRIRNQIYVCLLYTSDAADERSSVDLGGRRILKKKKRRPMSCGENKYATKRITYLSTKADL